MRPDFMRADLQLGFFSPARKALWSLMLSLKSCLSLSRIPAFARKPESKKWRKTSSIQGQGPRGAPQANAMQQQALGLILFNLQV